MFYIVLSVKQFCFIYTMMNKTSNLLSQHPEQLKLKHLGERLRVTHLILCLFRFSGRRIWAAALRHYRNVMETDRLLPKSKPKKVRGRKYVSLIIIIIIITIIITIFWLYYLTLRWVKWLTGLICCKVTMNHLFHLTSSDCWIVCGSDIKYQVYIE